MVRVTLSLLVVLVRDIDREGMGDVPTGHEALRWHARLVSLESLRGRVGVDRLGRGLSQVLDIVGIHVARVVVSAGKDGVGRYTTG
jgi:hypothetical protein